MKLKLLLIFVVILIVLPLVSGVESLCGKDSNTDCIIQDTFAEAEFGNNNHGTEDSFGLYQQFRDGEQYRGFLMYNNTIPAGVTITKAEIGIWVNSFDQTPTTLHMHACGGQTFNETILTWNNQFTGTTLNSLLLCNNTSEDTQLIDTQGKAHIFDVMSAIINMTNANYDNFTFVTMADDETSFTIGDIAKARSKEYTADTTLIHFLNITYTEVEPDTTPNEATFGNLTSQGGLGQHLNLTNPFCLNSDSVGCNVPRTNDTNPTLFFTSKEDGEGAIIDRNRNLNITDITKGSSKCSTTGTLRHICTLDGANETGRVGIHNFSFSLNDTSGNENRTATFFFSINITDPTSPNSTLEIPLDGVFFIIGTNNSPINFTWSSVDNIDELFDFEFYKDNLLIKINESLDFFSEEDLVLWIPFKESNGTNTTSDISTYGSDGTCEFGSNNCSFIAGVHGNALEFDGIDDYVNVSNFFNITGDFTLEAWVFDPIPESVETKEYTRGTERTCKDGKCNLVLYSGTRFVFQDNTWLDAQDARSLKEFYSIRYLKNDGVHDFEIVDLNYTSIELKVFVKDSKELNKDIPFKVDDIEKTTKRLTSLTDKPTVTFKSNNILASNYTFGTKSTVIILQDADTENLDDATVFKNSGDLNAGSSQFLQIRSGAGNTQNWGYIKFDITQIPVNQQIDLANLYLHVKFNGVTADIDVNHVFNNTWKEEDITFNNNPCGDDIDDAVQCNLIPEDSVVVDAVNVWFNWIVTTAVGIEYDEVDDNVSFILSNRSDLGGGSNQFRSKEWTTASERPYLNITYSAIVTPDSITRTIFDKRDTFKLGFNSTLGLRAELNGTNLSSTVNLEKKWYFIDFVYDGSNMLLYIDGKLNSSLAYTKGLPNNDFNLIIGSNGTSKFLNGSLDEVKIYKRALSGLEILTHFQNNTKYRNGTNISIGLTESVLGTHTWYVNTTDSFNNKNQSDIRSFTVEQESSISLFLNGLGEDRKYEYRSIVNISANCTGPLALTCQPEIDLDAPGFGFNFSSGDNFTSFLFNITTLRIVNFSSGPSSIVLSSTDILNVTSNNLTIMQRVTLNVTSSGTTTNLNITYFDRVKIFFGDIKSIYLEQTKFIESGDLKDAANLTYLTAGSNFIFSNLTDIDNPINMTFRLTGFDLDADNEFTYTEHFNGTDGAVGFNETLTSQADAPLGVFDDFASNVSGRWNIDGDSTGGILEYVSDCTCTSGTCIGESSTAIFDTTCLRLRSPPSVGTRFTSYTDNGGADFRNTSLINISYSYEINSEQDPSEVKIYITDGTSRIGIFSASVTNNLQEAGINQTILLKRKSEDFKTWNTFDISSLDFTKQIKLQFSTAASAGDGFANLWLQKIEWGGTWLGRSANNGTYKPIGNITSNVINVTKTNISKVTLTAVVHEPTDTGPIKFYLSNTCNNTIPIFESVTPGLIHTFGTTGNELCWRATLNSSVNISSPVIRKVQVDIVKTSIANITVDLGNDGTDDFTFIGTLNSTTGSLLVNLSPTTGILNTIKISSATPGLIQVDQFNINSSINPIVLNHADFEDCSECVINFSFSGSSITVEGLEWDFFGSWNYTAIARFGSLTISKIIQVFYSNFNNTIPSGELFYDVFPQTSSDKNVTPFTQTESRPIWNVSSLAYDEGIDIYVRTNETLNACLNITYTNNSFRQVNITNESIVWINGTEVNLRHFNLVNDSLVAFNQTSGLIFNSNNYTVEYSGGSITLNTTAGDIDLNRFEIGVNYSILVHGFDYGIQYTFKLNTSYQQILSNISPDTDVFDATYSALGIWNWWGLTSCSSRFEIPYVFFSSICVDCFFDINQLDNFNIITE